MKDALTDTLLDVTIMDESVTLTLVELCRSCAVDAEQISEMIDVGLIEPCPGDTAEWRFSGPSIYRVRVALRLHRDLRVNLSGAALALDLLEEIRRLRELAGQV